MLTKAQKENQARFKAVQAKAKELKAKSPKLTHIEAVKKAWALMPGKGVVKKTIKVKKMPIAGRLNLTGKETRLGYVPKKVAAVKKVAAKKPSVSKHKDTKSHNVNIKVVSGVHKFHALDQYKKQIDYIDGIEKVIRNNKDRLLITKNNYEKDAIKKELIYLKKLLAEYRSHARELKKLV